MFAAWLGAKSGGQFGGFDSWLRLVDNPNALGLRADDLHFLSHGFTLSQARHNWKWSKATHRIQT
jgi:hypothetical protein